MRNQPDRRDRLGRPRLFDQDAADAGQPVEAGPADGPAETSTGRVRTGWPFPGRRRRLARRPWLADQIGPRRRIQSMLELFVITVVLGLVIAAVLGVAIGTVVVSLQHALRS